VSLPDRRVLTRALSPLWGADPVLTRLIKGDVESPEAGARTATYGDATLTPAGVLTYKATPDAGGLDDILVATSTDSTGIEMPFLIRVNVKAAPACDLAGLSGGTVASVAGTDTLTVTRGVPVTLNHGKLCSSGLTDLTIGVKAPASFTLTKVDDNTSTMAANDPDKLGDTGEKLEVTATDSAGQATTRTLNVQVVDGAPTCKDQTFTYDRSVLGGAAFKLPPLPCTMPGGVKPLHPYEAQLLWTGPGGTLTQVDDHLEFTPDAGFTGDYAMLVPVKYGTAIVTPTFNVKITVK
jgi:hypothetical protein